MQKIIDLRLRPPYKSFTTTAFYAGYGSEASKRQRKDSGLVNSEAALQQSMELMIQEMDENNVVCGVAIARESSWGERQKTVICLTCWQNFQDVLLGFHIYNMALKKIP